MLANQEELEFKEKLHEKLDPNSRAPHIPRKKSKLQEPHQDNEGKTVIEMMTPVQPPAHAQEKLESEVVEGEEAVSHPLTNETAGTQDGLMEQGTASPAEDTADAGAEPTEQPVESIEPQQIELAQQVSPETRANRG